VSGHVAAVTLLAGVVAIAATIFGIVFSPEAHHEETAGDEHHAAHAEEEGAEGAVASSILISLAGVSLVPLALARRRPSQVALAKTGRPERASAAVAAALVLVALLSIGAAVIHFAVIAQHFEEWWLTGLFFVTIALFQLAGGLLALIQPSALLYVASGVVNALVFGTWIVSRTRGVPLGPEAGEAEAVGFPDALATAFEVVLVAVLAALLVTRSARRPALPSIAAEGWASAAVVASLTALALVMLA
jgi:hypothetical protein